jgi:pre-mRNA 3'-end-processing factor FIP1
MSTPAAASTTTPAAEATLAQPASGNGPPHTTALPHSTLPAQTAPATDPKIDGDHPTGIIPSTGTSVYDVDVAQFEGSGQMWRRPGSDISDWFNYGFDEMSYPRYLRYRQDMEQGRMALANMAGMGPMTPQVANLLHLPNNGGDVNPQLQQMQMQQQMQQMQQQMMMGAMDPAAMFAMQNQGMPGMMGGMMQQGESIWVRAKD